MGEYLSVRDLDAGYRDVVVSGVTFGATPGTILVIVGVNGAGKSTILKSIMGDARVHAGRVLLYGEEDVTGKSATYLAERGVGYVPQLNDVFPGLSVMQNLKMGGYMLPRRVVTQRIDRAIEQFPQLAPKKSTPAHKLSGGERKQLALARALMTDPRVILLDEPTSNLSPNLVGELLNQHIPSLAREDRAVVMVEQRVEAALQVASHGCLVGGGRMLRSGPAAEMLEIVRTHGLLAETAGVGKTP